MNVQGGIKIGLIFSLTVARGAAQPAPDLGPSDWIGQFTIGAKQTYFRIHFEPQREGPAKGTFMIPLDERQSPLERVTLNSAVVSFEAPDNPAPLVFRGRLRNGIITGQVDRAGDRGRFRLEKLANLNFRSQSQYEGNYYFGSGRFVSIGVSDEWEDRPTYFDSSSRRFGVFQALSPTKYIAGPAVIVDYPIDISVSFLERPNGTVSGLLWRQKGTHSAVRANKVHPHRREDVTFRNGDVTLKGSLISPATKGPHPGIVWVHGAGDKTRRAGFWPYFLVRRGIAVLTYDKRGCGQSTGNWREASFDDLGGDVTAAVDLLKGRPDIVANQIGVWGTSNGGWVVAAAAARSRDIGFVIVQVGSTLPPFENIEYEVESNLREAGFSEDEIKAGVALRRQLNHAIMTDTGWKELSDSATAAGNKKWFSLTRVGKIAFAGVPPDAKVLAGLRNGLDFDPAAAWQQVKCPVLALFGELDRTVPTARSVPILEQALKRGGNTRHMIAVLPRANHLLLEAETGYGSDYVRIDRFVAGYLDRVSDFLRSQLKMER